VVVLARIQHGAIAHLTLREREQQRAQYPGQSGPHGAREGGGARHQLQPLLTAGVC
jgi:hypothetical protein